MPVDGEAPPDVRRRDMESPVWERVRTNRELRALCALIMRADRDFPVVALTCRRHQRVPGLEPERVRRVIGPEVPLFVVAAGEDRAMKALLPPRLGVFDGAARVWWPGVDEHSDPRNHPLFFDRSGACGGRIIGEIANEFRVRGLRVAHLSPEQHAVLQERLRERAERRIGELEGTLDVLEQHSWFRSEKVVAELEAKLETPEWSRGTAADVGLQEVGGESQSEPASSSTGIGSEFVELGEELHVSIVKQWVQTLKGPYDWGEWPIQRYVVSDKFLRSLAGQSLDEVAWVCAMVASGLPRGSDTLAVERRVSETGSRTLVRADGAEGWSCTQSREGRAPVLLDFWVLESGVIEFDAFSSE
jgi:hypothetical protein